MQRRGSSAWSGANHLSDLHAVTIFDHDDFAARDQFAVHTQFDRRVGGFFKLNYRPDAQLQHLAHGQLATTEFDGETDRDIEDEVEIGRILCCGIHRLSAEQIGQLDCPFTSAGTGLPEKFRNVAKAKLDLGGAIRPEHQHIT